MIYLSQSTIAILAALYLSWRAIPEKSAAAWMLPTVTLLGLGAWGLVFWGDAGTLTKYRWEYQVQTSGFFAAMFVGYFTAGYVWTFYGGRDAIGPLIPALYLSVDVVANVLYRTTEWVYDWQEVLRQGVHLWHLAVVILAATVASRRFPMRPSLL